MPTLAELQDLFLMATTGADSANTARAELLKCVAPPPRGGSQDRLAVYRAHFASRHRLALAHSYPACECLLGTQNFTNLALLFLRTKLPRAVLLDEWAIDLPEAIIALQRDHAELAAWPCLSDLARLERAIEAVRRGELAPSAILSLHPLDALWNELMASCAAEAPFPIEVEPTDTPQRFLPNRSKNGAVAVRRV